jgi:hypothetical protein
VRKVAFASIALLLAGSGPPAGSAAEPAGRGLRRGEARPARHADEPVVIGTIRYDTGINAGFHPDGASGGNLNRVVGNRFNTNLGLPLMMTNMIFRLTVFPANSGTQSLSIANGPNSMGSAVVVDYLNVNLMANEFNAVPFSPAVTVGPEFLGLFLGAFSSTQAAGLLGMSDMATMGQGYHAIEGFYLLGAVTMLVPVPNRNAMMRASIDVFPVELMDFRLE